MSNTEVVRAWKDPAYRAMLSEAPALPIGSIELDDPYLSETNMVSNGFAFRRGEHTSVFCHTHFTCGCHTHIHCTSSTVNCA
jgi:mersacidin/lichenicidin family type 2 lantibiotic